MAFASPEKKEEKRSAINKMFNTWSLSRISRLICEPSLWKKKFATVSKCWPEI